jgi:translation initiation factor 1
MSDEDQIVWSSEHGDLRKQKNKGSSNQTVDEASLELNVKRLTSGKGRTVIELTALPENDKWCKKLAKDLKKSLGVGGAFKKNYIEIHGEMLDKVTAILDSRKIKWKKV